MKARKKNPRLEIIAIEGGEVVHTVAVADKSERSIERVLMGLLRNLDRERFFVREVDL